MDFSQSDVCIVVASNDEVILKRNLLASRFAMSGIDVHVVRDAPSAAMAYNRGLDSTSSPVVVFAHQDVWFPDDWGDRLAEVLRHAPDDWAILAPFGVTREGRHVGDVWSSSLGRRVGQPVAGFEPIESVDELIIILRRSSGLRFDEELPNWHFYGTDIVQTARSEGLGAYVVRLPVVHNDAFKASLGKDFTVGYRFIQKKWVMLLPIRTSIVWVTRTGVALFVYRLRAWFRLSGRRALAQDPVVSPRAYARQCGLEVVDRCGKGAD